MSHQRVASPNHGARRGGVRPSLIVLHYTAMPGGADPVIRHFRKPEVELSAHYVVGRRGRVVQMVDEARRAWHAGAGRWGAISDVNSASVGIEICNGGDQPFGAGQMDAVCELVAGIMARHAIPPQCVIGHSDLAPGRKIDPGARFDWRRLAREGLSVWPMAQHEPAADSAGLDPARFAADLARFGYTAEASPETLLAAFRLRFRPGHDGPMDTIDAGFAADLAARWPAAAVDAAMPAQ